MMRSVSLGILLMATFFLPWWAVLGGVAIYALSYRAYELVPLMILVDGYYGVLDTHPFLSVGTVVMVMMMVFLRPLLWRSPYDLA